MTDFTQDFLADLAALSEPLLSAYRETIEYWAPEKPPVTTAYSEVGQRIVVSFNEMDAATRAAVFDKIEIGMASDEEPLGTAVATGLVEGMVGRAARVGNWEVIRNELRPATRRHADAWYES